MKEQDEKKKKKRISKETRFYLATAIGCALALITIVTVAVVASVNGESGQVNAQPPINSSSTETPPAGGEVEGDGGEEVGGDFAVVQIIDSHIKFIGQVGFVAVAPKKHIAGLSGGKSVGVASGRDHIDGGKIREHFLQFCHPFFDGKETRFLRIDKNPHRYLVANRGRAADNIQMPFCGRVKTAGEKTVAKMHCSFLLSWLGFSKMMLAR